MNKGEGGNSKVTTIWPNLKVGLLVAMLYSIYFLIQSIKTFKSMIASGIRETSKS